MYRFSQATKRDMEDTTQDTPIVIKRSHYQSSLLLCLMVSLGICATILPSLPSDDKDKSTYHGDLTYLITRSCLTVLIIFFQSFVWYVVRNRDSFHQSQTIFWPMRCKHCAEAVGLRPCPLKNEIHNLPMNNCDAPSNTCDAASIIKNKHDEGKDCQPSDSNFPFNQNHGLRIFCRSNSLDERHISRIAARVVDGLSDSCYEGSETNDIDKSTAKQEPRTSRLSLSPEMRAKSASEAHNKLYQKPHMSLLNTFYIFGTIALINIPLPIIANIMCIVTLNNHAIMDIVLVGQILLDSSFVTLILFGMLFFKNFYDAAFVDRRQFTFPLAVILAGCFWIVAVKILYPISALVRSKYGHVDYPCHLPGKFGIVVMRQEITLTPFYAECGIIGAALVWQMWSSTVERALLTKTNTRFQNLGPIYNKLILRKMTCCVIDLFRCRKFKMVLQGSNKEERKNLLPATKLGKSRKVQGEPVNMKLIIAFHVLIGIVYFTLVQIFDYSSLGLQESLPSTQITIAYLKWFLHIVFYLPLLMTYRFRIYLTDSAKQFRPRSTVSLVSGLIGGHDRIIMISCIGIFTLNIFRMASSLGILFDNSHENTILACYTGIFAIFQTYCTWAMTSFLVIVQRQEIVGRNQARWTLICLIYTGILNATQWAIDSVEVGTWIELTTYYGQIKGTIIGVLLEPIASLYGIHSAMITYEAYKTVCKDVNLRRDMLTTTESYI